MTLARSAVLLGVALVAALAVCLLLLRGGGHEYTLIFENAGQLVKGDNVQIGGRAVGTVGEIELTDNNQAAVTVTVNEPYAPLREGTQALIRLTSLSGIANRYVALSPGPGANRALRIRPRSTRRRRPRRSTSTSSSTRSTRRPAQDLQGIIKGFQVQFDGKGDEAAESTKYFNPLLSSARRLVNETTEDEAALTEFIVSSSRTVTAIAERRDDLADLVGNANATTGAIAAENRALSEALAAPADDAAARRTRRS